MPTELDILIIPIVSSVVGWGTNSLAIQMLFKPLQRRGWGIISWQGVLPTNAHRMATICVQLMTSRLLDVKKLFTRIEAERISGLLTPVLEEQAEKIVEAALLQRLPKMWKALPEKVRLKARQRISAEIPNVIEKLMDDLHADLGKYLDIEKLVVDSFVRNRHLLNELFWRCGKTEFIFIARSGLIFGGLFGIIQMLIWYFVQPDWFLPVTGLLVGWATNWIALKMVFEPLEAKTIGPFLWQGLFLRRQEEVSEAYAAFFAEHILHPEALVSAVLTGSASDKVMDLLELYIAEAIEQASDSARRIIKLAIGSSEWEQLKGEISQQLSAVIPAEMERVHEYTKEALDLEQELCRNLKGLSPAEFEGVLRPLFQEEESTLIAVGAVLGGIAGIIQWLIVSTL